MRLRNEVTVAAPVDETWRLLLDVPRVARALPGATVEPAGEAGLYRGELRVKVGPVTAEYEGVARLQDVDDDERVASFHVQGRERRGHGTAAATITSRVAEADGATWVIVETDLNVTGRAAQFGRGIMEDVAGRLLAEFASRLEREVAAAAGGRPEAAPAAPEALDLGRTAWASAVRGVAPLAVAALAGALLASLVRGRIVIVVDRR